MQKSTSKKPRMDEEYYVRPQAAKAQETGNYEVSLLAGNGRMQAEARNRRLL